MHHPPRGTVATVRLAFAGTRGYVEESSRFHREHSALLLAYRGRRLLLDAGATWAGKLARLRPDAIAVTHAHPDHAFGVRGLHGVPVYGTATTLRLLRRFALDDPRTVRLGEEVAIGPFLLTAYSVVHSLRAPAVGFRVRAGGVTVVYNPDLIAIRRPAAALRGADVYVGDGASLVRPIIRRRDGRRFGHTTISEQLRWCGRYGIPRAFVVHCGRQLVTMTRDEAQRRVEALAPPGVRVTVAIDGMRVALGRRTGRRLHRPFTSATDDLG